MRFVLRRDERAELRIQGTERERETEREGERESVCESFAKGRESNARG